jgi:hypothetical protein
MIRTALMSLFALLSFSAAADQFKAFDGIEVHYIVINTLFLQPDVAARYDVVRAGDRAIVNLSIIDENGTAMVGEVTGSTINLLGQTAALQFSVTDEGDAIYYIAPLRYTDQDVLRFRLTITVPGRAPMNLEFQQQMFAGGTQ